MSNKRLNPPHPLWGWFCIILGVIPLLVGLGIIQADQPDKDAPMVIVSLAGLIFLISVIMILIDNYSRAHFYCAVLICLSFALVSGWATITASLENISGGLPFVSDETSILLARLLFEFGVIISGGLAIYALKEFILGNKINGE
ncbi:MAG: hypothetical protein HKN83_04040 [Gammaproteobacteria bacterium]|nr:hypothetical protein [Gammaproteobacteria bacterium]